MEPEAKGTVILLPKTVDYYQMQLTRMLEGERYAEAIGLLRFLLQCRPDDPRTTEEWRMLLSWMEAQFTEGEAAQEGAEPEGEAEMLEAHVAERTKRDAGYGEKLLQMLTESESLEKQLLALEQLAFAPDPELDGPIARWLGGSSLHPLVQFKGLQTLKNRGAQMPVHIVKEGRLTRIDLDEVPARFDDFPRLIQYVAIRVQEVCEVNSPGLAFFAEQVWKEFLAFSFATAVYAELVKLEEEDVAVWAAGLHAVSSALMGGAGGYDETASCYGLTENDRRAWERACGRIRSVFRG